MISALLAALLAAPGAALAASQASLQAAPDGTVVVIGDGWRPGQELVVSLGRDRFPAFVDSGGSVEVVTGLTAVSGSVSVRRLDPANMAFVALEAPEPHPLAVLFAPGVASVLVVYGVATIFAALGYIGLRRFQR